VIGGYSQGGTVAQDLALRYSNIGIGSLVMVASSIFENSPSLGGMKDFEGTRFRVIVGKNDIWFPARVTGHRLKTLVPLYNLETVGDFPEVLEGTHMLFD